MRTNRALASVVVFVSTLCAVTQAAKQSSVGRLASPERIDGVPCDAGEIGIFADSARLESCRLASEATVRGARLPAGTFVAFEPSGAIRFAFLPDTDPLVGGHACRGTSGHDWMTTFHPDGTLNLCWLARDEEIDGVPCARATFWKEVRGGAATRFRPDGRLASCRLSRDVTIGGQSYHSGEHVTVSDTGEVTRASGR